LLSTGLGVEANTIRHPSEELLIDSTVYLWVKIKPKIVVPEFSKIGHSDRHFKTKRKTTEITILSEIAAFPFLPPYTANGLFQILDKGVKRFVFKLLLDQQITHISILIANAALLSRGAVPASKPPTLTFLPKIPDHPCDHSAVES
jgi:hypothetical protein